MALKYRKIGRFYAWEAHFIDEIAFARHTAGIFGEGVAAYAWRKGKTANYFAKTKST
jgi:hypothetical protein